MKKRKGKYVNLARAMRNYPKCLGYCWQMSKGNYEYQNDNDLGLDLESIDCKLRYNKKYFVGKGYYFYVMWGLWGDCEDEVEHMTLNMVALLLKECHKTLFTLTKREQKRLEKYWGQF